MMKEFNFFEQFTDKNTTISSFLSDNLYYFLNLNDNNLLNIFSQKYEDNRGESVLMYVSEHTKSEEFKIFLDSAPFRKLCKNNNQFVRDQLVLRDEHSNSILMSTVKAGEFEKFDALLKSLFSFLSSKTICEIFTDTGSGKISALDVVRDADNKFTSAILNNSDVNVIDVNDLLLFIKALKIPSDTLEVNSITTPQLDRLKIIADSAAFKVLSLDMKKELLQCNDSYDYGRPEMGDEVTTELGELCHHLS